MAYSYPNNISKFSDLLVWSNEVTSNWFGVGTLLLLFAVVFISTIQFGAKKAFAISSWLCLFLSFGWFAIGIVSGREVFFCAVFVAISVVALFMEKN